MKTKGMGIALLSTAALLGSAVAQAELPWTYAEFGYSKADGSDAFEVDAYDLKVSAGFLEKWHASLTYTDGEADLDSEPGIDYDGYQLIVGAHPQLTPSTQLITDITYFDYEADGDDSNFNQADVSEDGYGLGFGLRHSLTEKLEIMAEVWYVDGNFDVSGFGDEDFNETTLEVGGRYNWLPQLSTGLTLYLDGNQATSAIGSGGDVIRFDVRWSFLGGLSK
jgi:hypothetical protein